MHKHVYYLRMCVQLAYIVSPGADPGIFKRGGGVRYFVIFNGASH